MDEQNPARALEAYVDRLGLAKLDYGNIQPTEINSGWPAYAPDMLLKPCLYECFNRVRSTRRLEQECHRSVEVMWLVHGLKPRCKTIVDFRRDNRKATWVTHRALMF